MAELRLIPQFIIDFRDQFPNQSHGLESGG